MDANPDAPIALWLRTTRARQKMDDGEGGLKPWTVDHFLELMKAEVGWAPARPNYSRYENGRTTPQPKTLAKFVAFWRTQGVEAPDFDATPVEPEPEPSLAAALFAIRDELRDARQERKRTEARLRAVEAELRSLRDQRGGGGSSELSPPLEKTGSGR